MSDVRLELRIKNQRLWSAIHDTHATVAAFCREFDLNQSEVGQLISMRVSPWGAGGDLRLVPSRLVEITGIGADELFPERLYQRAMLGRAPGPLTSVVGIDRLLTMSAAKMLTVPALDDTDETLAEDKRAVVAAAVATLTPREQLVIEERFGLIGEERTLGQVGELMGVSKERVRQVEAKALRKLRQPSRQRRIRRYA